MIMGVDAYSESEAQCIPLLQAIRSALRCMGWIFRLPRPGTHVDGASPAIRVAEQSAALLGDSDSPFSITRYCIAFLPYHASCLEICYHSPSLLY